MFGGVVSKFEAGEHTRVPSAADYAMAKVLEEAEGNGEALDRCFDNLPALVDVDEEEEDMYVSFPGSR